MPNDIHYGKVTVRPEGFYDDDLSHLTAWGNGKTYKYPSSGTCLKCLWRINNALLNCSYNGFASATAWQLGHWLDRAVSCLRFY